MTPVDIKVYPDKRCGSVELRYRLGGRVVRETHPVKQAKARTHEIARYVNDLTRPLTVAEAQDYLRAIDRLGNTPLSDAVDFYLLHHQGSGSCGLREMVAGYLTACVERNEAPGTVRTKQTHLDAFLRHVTVAQLREVIFEQVKAFIESYENPKTSNNVRVTLLAFFNWARKEGRLPDGMHVLDRTSARKIKAVDPVPFAPESLRTLFVQAQGASDAQSAFVLALAAFAGLRLAEIQRLRWKDLTGLSEDVGLILSSSITKTNRRRGVKCCPAFLAWLNWYRDRTPEVFRKPASLVIRRRNVNRALNKLAEDAGVAWVDNGLRKGFVSSLTALIGPEKTARQAGHSTDTLETNYKGLVTEESAREWFSIFPS